MSNDSSATGTTTSATILAAAAAVADAVAKALAKNVVTPTTPIRGGVDKTHGVFLGGSIIGPITYKMDPSSKAMAYHSTSQCRGHKDLFLIEASLETLWLSTTIDKFDENVSVANGSSELNKIQFIETLEGSVMKHGQEIFYFMKHPDDSTKPLVSLFEMYHRFTVEDIVSDFKNRCKTTVINPTIEFELRKE